MLLAATSEWRAAYSVPGAPLTAVMRDVAFWMVGAEFGGAFDSRTEGIVLDEVTGELQRATSFDNFVGYLEPGMVGRDLLPKE